ncbi:MAG: hypothetical protein EHM40_02715 [Chloroflexi bacterium]|nr:MAG: hypothetical protein EHM40_02715 [Chloroflexota bacterium]
MSNIIGLELQDSTRRIVVKEYDEAGNEIGQYNKSVEVFGLTQRAADGLTPCPECKVLGGHFSDCSLRRSGIARR